MKRYVRITLRISLGIVIFLIIVATFLGLYKDFFGELAIQRMISAILGVQVEFDAMRLDRKEHEVDFEGFHVASDIELDKTIFNAEDFHLKFNAEKFDNERKIVFEEIVIKKGTLNVERKKNGLFILSDRKLQKKSYNQSLAYAESADEAGSRFYYFVKNLKSFVIEDSVINFKDNYISDPPYKITCDNLNVNVESSRVPTPRTLSVPVKCDLSFTIPSDVYADQGEVNFKATMAVYTDRVDIDSTITTKHVDVMRFQPYFKRVTPFTFSRGLFSSNTHFEVHNLIVKSLTDMVFHDIDISASPGEQDSVFLHTQVNKLIPYLTSGEGDIAFDFVVEGPIRKPKIGLGPQVKFAIGMVVVEEIGELMKQIQKLQE